MYQISEWTTLERPHFLRVPSKTVEVSSVCLSWVVEDSVIDEINLDYIIIHIFSPNISTNPFYLILIYLMLWMRKSEG